MTHASAKRARTGWILLVVVALAVFYAWNEGMFRRRVGSEPIGLAPRSREAVSSAIAERRLIPRIVEAAGTVSAGRSASLSARIAGVVEEFLVDEGSRVRKGDELVRLSAPDLESRGAAARGAVAAARAGLEQAERDHRRIQKLFDRGAATAIEHERATTGLEQARGDLARALGESKAASSIAGFAVLDAPFNGLVTRRRVDVGDLASPGAPVLELADDSWFVVEAEVPESVARQVRIGDDAEVVVDALDLRERVRVTEIVPAADPVSRTVVVKLDLPSRAGVRVGLFARARLAVGEREGIVVPEAAIRSVGELRFVDVLRATGEPERHHVEVGPAFEAGRVEVLAGLAGGERVATGR